MGGDGFDGFQAVGAFCQDGDVRMTAQEVADALAGGEFVIGDDSAESHTVCQGRVRVTVVPEREAGPEVTAKVTGVLAAPGVAEREREAVAS